HGSSVCARTVCGLMLALLPGGICIPLWDFIEEDKIRRLPPGERAMHAVMGIVYGAFLARLAPEMLTWAARPTGFGASYHGFPAWMLSVIAAGVFVSGVRDLAASFAAAARATGGRAVPRP